MQNAKYPPRLPCPIGTPKPPKLAIRFWLVNLTRQEKEFLIQISKKWVALAWAHVIVLAGLTLGLAMIAIRLDHPPQPISNAIPAIPTEPPSDAEITRLKLLSTRIDVMQNNLSNADTIAFKRQLVNVEEGNQPRISDLHLDMTQGPLQETHINTDLAIQGEGFFHVKVRPTIADGTAYTRNGTLRQNSHGDLVIAIGEGYPLIPPINIPIAATNIAIDPQGTISFQPPASTRIVTAGQIQLCHFRNPQQLDKVNGLYTETFNSGPAIASTPGENGAGSLFAGYLESSNVDPLKEWAALLRAQKMLQFSTQTAQIDGKAFNKNTPIALYARPAGADQ